MKLLDIIKFPIFQKVDERRKSLILETDPQRIYLENVRSLFNTSSFTAKLLCDMAVKDGVFIKKIGLICPNVNCERIIKSYNNNELIDEELSCDHCELIENDSHIFKSQDLKRIEFYQLAK